VSRVFLESSNIKGDRHGHERTRVGFLSICAHHHLSSQFISFSFRGVLDTILHTKIVQ